MLIDKKPTGAHCIDLLSPREHCPDVWRASEPMSVSGQMLPTERCCGCGQVRLVVKVESLDFLVSE